MKQGQSVELCFATLFLSLTLWREALSFRRFRLWKRTGGIVEGFNLEGDGAGSPVIGYSVGGVHRTFESSFCLYNPAIGESVTVLYDPASDKAVLHTKRHRWFLSVLLGTFFAILLWSALLHH